MLKFFVRRPITTLMFVLVWVLLGLVAYPRINIERTPSLDFPIVTATFIYPGAASDEIESQVIKRAEDAISEVPGVKHITSRIYENGGFIVTEFNLGINANDKAAEIKTKIDGLASQFPDDLKQPVVEKMNPLQQAVMDIVLSGPSSTDIKQYIDDVLGNKITDIDGVAKVSTFGGRERAILVAMDPDLMAARGVTIMDVIAALGNKNLNVPGGKIEYGSLSNNVRFIGEFADVSEIANLPISTSEGIRFKLSDVASITDAARDIENGARYNGTDVVIASVEKANDGNAIKISRALRKKLPDLNADFAAHFPNVKTNIEIISDSSTAISDDTNDTINGIILGVIFTVLVLLAFTRNWRSTVIAGVVIPASLIGGFEFVEASGFTINAITLLAYSSALGTLVSNAIILIESALQEMRAGKDSETAAIDGTKKVAVSVLAGVGTNVVVFLPLAFMGGIVGKFMIQFGLTVVYLTLLSLMFSFTLTPMMIAKFLKLSADNKKEIAAKEASNKKAEKASWLRKWFDYQMAHAGRVVGIAFLVLVASAMLMRFVGNEFQPSTDMNEITITARAPMGATYEKSEQIVNEIEKRLADVPEIKSLTAKIGSQGLQNIQMRVELIDKAHRRKTDKKLTQEILPMLNGIPDAEIQIRAGQAMSSISSDIVLNIYGEDDALRESYAKRIIDEITKIEEVQSAVLAQQSPANEVRFIPDADKMDFWGIKNSVAGTALRYAVYGNDTYKYKENGSEYPIIVKFAKPFKTQNLFDVVYVNSPKGMVALSQLGAQKEVPATPDIRRLDKNRITEIDINLGKSTLGPVQSKITSVLKQIDWAPGYTYKFGGMSEIQGDTTGEIGQAFLLASVLTFMLLAAILNSLTHPLTIATSIITSFAGVFIVLFLSGASMNIGAMLAFVMLVGLVVNNSILVLEPTVNRIRRGEKVSNALWTELNQKKNMVLMTSIAVAAGMLPQMFGGDGMKTAMSSVLIGGMLASMAWTFALTPALFVVMENFREKVKNKLKK